MQSKRRQNWNKAVCKNSNYWAEFVLNTLGTVWKVLDLLMWNQKVIVIIFLTLKGCQLCINHSPAERVALTTVTSSIKTAATEKYFREKCFYFTFEIIFCGFNFVVPLSSQYLCAHLSSSTEAGGACPHPRLMSSTTAEAWLLWLKPWSYICWCLMRRIHI